MIYDVFLTDPGHVDSSGNTVGGAVGGCLALLVVVVVVIIAVVLCRKKKGQTGNSVGPVKIVLQFDKHN